MSGGGAAEAAAVQWERELEQTAVRMSEREGLVSRAVVSASIDCSSGSMRVKHEGQPFGRASLHPAM